MKKLFALTFVFVVFCSSQWMVPAQDQPAQQPTTEELEREKAEREKNAYRLLEQVIDEGQSLKLTENRVRVQINGADMLWDQNEGRARSLFMMAAEGIAELGRSQATPVNRRDMVTDGSGNIISSGPGPRNMRSFQLRQELILAAARHDATLAYQLLASTKPPATTLNDPNQRGPRAQLTSEDNLEQTLLARIAALDPTLAAQNAEQMMEKGQFPRSLPEVINQLHRQDAEAATKLAEKTVKRVQSANILTNNEAAALAQMLVSSGPRLPAPEGVDAAAPKPPGQGPVQGRAPVLEQSLYVELLSSVIDAALKVNPAAQNNQRGQTTLRRVQGGPGNRPNTGSIQPTEPQIEQSNARRLLAGLQPAMGMIDQFLPAKAQLVRQKMSEMGMANNSTANFAQAFSAIQGNPTTDALVQAAANAPQQMRSRLYQQAAYKALEEGDTERARQIATDHLQNNAREVVMQRIDFREMTKKADGARFDEIRQAVARLQSDNEKIEMLVQLAGDANKTNQKLAVQLLEEARQITNRRATSYQHFEQQLKVARAFAAVDPARSFEVLEPAINQLNELLAAASVLSGFEINMFRDGEMALQGGNGLTATVNRFGQELAVLAKSDFERSETLTSRFQFLEPRIMTRMSIVQGLLNVKPDQTRQVVFGNFGENFVIRQE